MGGGGGGGGGRGDGGSVQESYPATYIGDHAKFGIFFRVTTQCLQ